MNPEQNIVICCSGRGDKDVEEAARLLTNRAAQH
jgi:tryptophan synthase beta subunit